MIQPLTLYAGETRLLTVTVVDVDTGAPTSIASADAIEFQANLYPGAADPPLIAKALGSGITRLTQAGATLGQFTIALDPIDTQDRAGRLYYDVVVIVGTARHYVVEPSTLTIRPTVNRP